MKFDKARKLTVLRREKSRAELRLAEAVRIQESCKLVIGALETRIEQLERGET